MVAIDENWRMLNASFMVCFIFFLCAYILSIRTTERGSNIKKIKENDQTIYCFTKEHPAKSGKSEVVRAPKES
jgi:hypothetical protein